MEGQICHRDSASSAAASGNQFPNNGGAHHFVRAAPIPVVSTTECLLTRSTRHVAVSMAMSSRVEQLNNKAGWWIWKQIRLVLQPYEVSVSGYDFISLSISLGLDIELDLAEVY